MAVWVEELGVDNFKVCLREAKIFDGPHKNIKIVSEFDIIFLSLDNSLYPSIKKIPFIFPKLMVKAEGKTMSSCPKIHVLTSVTMLPSAAEVNPIIYQT